MRVPSLWTEIHIESNGCRIESGLLADDDDGDDTNTKSSTGMQATQRRPDAQQVPTHIHPCRYVRRVFFSLSACLPSVCPWPSGLRYRLLQWVRSVRYSCFPR